MEIEPGLQRIVDLYTEQGYQITVYPTPDQLPAFAKDFKVELLGRRAKTNLLISAKKNRSVMAEDHELPRYAEVIAQQPGWRYDLTIMEADNVRARELKGVQELSDDELNKTLSDAENLIDSGLLRPALITAWSGFEAALRRKLREVRKDPKPESLPRQMMVELYSNDLPSWEAYPRLLEIYRLWDEVVHGFASPNLDAEVVQFLIGAVRELLEVSQVALQPA